MRAHSTLACLNVVLLIAGTAICQSNKKGSVLSMVDASPPHHVKLVFTYKFIADEDKKVKALFVYKGRRLVQKLPLPQQEEFRYDDFGVGVSEEDFDFDGHPDLRLMTLVGGRGNSSSYVWLYSAKSSRFVFSQALSELASVSADPKTRTIISVVDNGCMSLCGEREVYHWASNHRLRMIEAESQEMDSAQEGCFLHTLTKLRKGKMTEVLRESVDKEGKPCPLKGKSSSQPN